MKYAVFLLSVAILCFFLNSKGQNSPARSVYEPVSPGDQIPEVVLNNIHFYKDGKVTFPAVGSKLVILNFWDTRHSSVIEKCDRMENLQEQFKKDIQFINVTWQNETEVLPFIEKVRKGRPAIIPSLTDDRLLHLFFPERHLRRVVWIFEGKLIAVTKDDEVNAKNIVAIIGHTVASLSSKSDKMKYLSGAKRQDRIAGGYISFLLPGNYHDLPSGFVELRNNLGQKIGIAIINLPMKEIYETVVSRIFSEMSDRYSKNRSQLWVSDSSRVTPVRELRKAPLYSYLCLGSFKDDPSLSQFILSDLNELSDYKGTIEYFKKKCLVLRRTSNDDKIKSSGGIPHNSLFLDSSSTLVNLPVDSLITSIEKVVNLPVLDETQYRGNIDIQLFGKHNRIKLSRELNAYELELTEAERPMNFFVLIVKDLLGP